jgi:hypothetical protein
MPEAAGYFGNAEGNDPEQQLEQPPARSKHAFHLKALR